MANLTTGNTWVNGETITYTKLNNTVNNATLSGIVNADLDASAGIVDTKLAQIATAGKVNGSAITSLANVPSGAGVLPIANIATGTPDGTKFVRDDGTLVKPTGTIVAVSYYQRQDEVSCATAIPANNSSRTSSEGNQVLTVAHTPASNSNILRITVCVNYGSAQSNNCMILMDGTTVLATSRKGYALSGANEEAPMVLVYYMTSPGTSAKTFNVNCGGTATGKLNTCAGATSMDNGKLISSITVEEIAG